MSHLHHHRRTPHVMMRRNRTVAGGPAVHAVTGDDVHGVTGDGVHIVTGTGMLILGMFASMWGYIRDAVSPWMVPASISLGMLLAFPSEAQGQTTAWALTDSGALSGVERIWCDTSGPSPVTTRHCLVSRILTYVENNGTFSIQDAEVDNNITINGGSILASSFVLDIEAADQTADGDMDYDTVEEVIEVGDDGVGTLKFYPGVHNNFTPNADPGVDHGSYVAGHSNGGNCNAGNYPLGVDASGAVENCTPDDTGTDTLDDLSDDLITALSGVTTVTDGNYCQGGAGSSMDCDVATIPDGDVAATLHRDSEVKDGDLVSFDDPDSNFTATDVDEALSELFEVDGGGPNSATGKVDWSQLVSVPAGFADGVDADSGGAPAFSSITGDTNTTAAMVVGTGATLGTSGSGAITASAGDSGVTFFADQDAGTNLAADLEEETHASEHAENAADELLGEGLGTACSENQILKADATGGLVCAADAGGAETNDLESVATSAGTNEIFVGSGVDAGAYIAIAACAADEKIEYTDGAPNTFTCESIGGLVDADITFTAPGIAAATATTPSVDDNDTSVATTAFVQAETFAGDVSGTIGTTQVDDVQSATSNLEAANNDTTQVATTSFVQQELNGAGGTGLTCATGTCNVDIGTAIDAGEITAAAIDGDDVNSNIAGAHLTLTAASPDTLDADASLTTHVKTVAILSPTTGEDGLIRFVLSGDSSTTITKFWCDTDTSTATINLEERAETTPNTVGTDVASSDVVCDTNSQTATLSNTGIDLNDPLAVMISAVGTPGVVNIHVRYTVDE